MRNLILFIVVLCIANLKGMSQILTSEISVEETNGVTSISGLVGIGTNAPSKELDVEGEVRWGANSNVLWGDGLLSLNSGWSSGSYPTLGSVGGTNGSIIMLHNPHVPFRTDNTALGYTGRSGLRMAIDSAASEYWDMGLAGDFFHVFRKNTGELFRITNNGNVGIGIENPTEKLDVEGQLRWGVDAHEAWGEGLLHVNSGWGTLNFPTIGSVDGINGSLIMLHNPHVPFRTDNPFTGFTGRAGLRMATDANASSFWDMGLAGDYFHIARKNSGEFIRISNTGNVGIGNKNPEGKLDILGASNGGVTSIVLSQSRGTVSAPLNSVANGADGNYILFKNYYNNQYVATSYISGNTDNTAPDAGRLTFFTRATGSGNTPQTRMIINSVGNVGIGTTSPAAKLHVNGTIKAPATDWSDFVFKDDYELPTLEEVESYIDQNGHLKDIPSEEEVKREDVDLTQMDSRLLQKIEELTLYVIEQNKLNKQQQEQILKLEERIRQLENH